MQVINVGCAWDVKGTRHSCFLWFLWLLHCECHKKEDKLLQDSGISAAYIYIYIPPPVETHTVWPFIKAKSIKSLEKRLSRGTDEHMAQKYKEVSIIWRCRAGLHPQPACSSIILNQRNGILLSISVLHSTSRTQHFYGSLLACSCWNCAYSSHIPDI